MGRLPEARLEPERPAERQHKIPKSLTAPPGARSPEMTLPANPEHAKDRPTALRNRYTTCSMIVY